MQDVRWEQRLQNFNRAVGLLAEAVGGGIDQMSDLEKEGTVHRFELALELAWKTLKDYLQFAGTTVKPVTPRAVIKESFAAGILPDGQVWIDMLNHRNLLSHTYDENTYKEAVGAISEKYLGAILELRDWLNKKARQ